MTVGVLSTITAIFPSSTCAAITSGRCVYLTLGNGLNSPRFLPSSASTRLCSVTVRPSMRSDLRHLSSFSTMLLSALPFIYTMDVSDFVISPILYTLNMRSLSLIRRLISAIFVIMDSTKPSLAPRRLCSFDGSCTLLSGYDLQSMMMIPSYPDISSGTSPEYRYLIA